MSKRSSGVFSCHSKLDNNNHVFTIHTGNVDDKKEIVAEIFEEGRFVATRHEEYAVRENDGDLKIKYDFLSEITREFHLSVADEIEALFTVSGKIENKNTPQAHYRLGVIFLNKNFLDEAEKHFKLAIDKQNDIIRAHFGLVIIKMIKNDYAGAIKILEENEEKAGDYADFCNYMGVAQLLAGNYTKAVSYLKKAVEKNANFLEGQFNLGVALYFSAVSNVNDEKAIGLPARVTLYLKQLSAKNKYKSTHWQKRFEEVINITKSNNHLLIKSELEKFCLEITNLSTEKDKVYEFFLRFMYGGRDMDLAHIANFQPHLERLEKEYGNYPDLWNDLGVFNLIKSRIYLIKAIEVFKKASNLMDGMGEGAENYQIIKGKEKGFLLLLRAILKEMQ